MDAHGYKREFEETISGIKGDIALAGQTGVHEGAVRALYRRNVEEMVEEIRRDVADRHLTWAEAAERAHEARNTILATMRGRSTPFGRAVAEALKPEGRTFNELIARYTIKLFGANAQFDYLSTAQRNQIYGEIVAAAARANPKATADALRWSRAGRGLLYISLAIACYNIYNADDKGDAIAHEGAVAGAGILGGAAAGALAGLACGPGAPVCVGIGAFVGGALAAGGVDYFWGR